MTNKGLPKLAFNALDRITDIYPPFAPKVFQKIFLSIFGSAFIYSYYLKIYQRQLLDTKKTDKILFIVDLNIGDAILLQKSIEILKYNFPGARIDYMCNKNGGNLISKLPLAGTVHNIFKGGMPDAQDINDMSRILLDNNYDLVLNLSPFLTRKYFPKEINVIQLYIPFSAYTLYLWRLNEQMHISSQICSFLNNFLKPLQSEEVLGIIEIINSPYKADFRGNSVYLSHDAIETAHRFLESNNIFSMERLLLFNPDVTIKYSMIPFATQIQILHDVLDSKDIDYVLITAAYFNSGLEDKLLQFIPEELHGKIIIVPHMPLDAYVALIDLCDVFLTGDTGPLHIAASWKEPIEENDRLRNRTAVVSVIGPTDSRMFCYDSDKPGHLPANQDAPSRVFVAESPCRNVTCLNKTGKT